MSTSLEYHGRNWLRMFRCLRIGYDYIDTLAQSASEQAWRSTFRLRNTIRFQSQIFHVLHITCFGLVYGSTGDEPGPLLLRYANDTIKLVLDKETQFQPFIHGSALIIFDRNLHDILHD